jgi:hypothetical protein
MMYVLVWLNALKVDARFRLSEVAEGGLEIDAQRYVNGSQDRVLHSGDIFRA